MEPLTEAVGWNLLRQGHSISTVGSENCHLRRDLGGDVAEPRVETVLDRRARAVSRVMSLPEEQDFLAAQFTLSLFSPLASPALERTGAQAGN